MIQWVPLASLLAEICLCRWLFGLSQIMFIWRLQRLVLLHSNVSYNNPTNHNMTQFHLKSARPRLHIHSMLMIVWIEDWRVTMLLVGSTLCKHTSQLFVISFEIHFWVSAQYDLGCNPISSGLQFQFKSWLSWWCLWLLWQQWLWFDVTATRLEQLFYQEFNRRRTIVYCVWQPDKLTLL